MEKDKASAVKWYREAAKQGYARAQVSLGDCYAQGTGIEKNVVEAAKWYRKATEQGSAEAAERLKSLGEPLPK